MNQRALFIIIVVTLFCLGMFGQYQIAPHKLTENLSTSIYEILMLFLLDGEWTLDLDSVPLAIEIVRFAAPLVAIASIVLVIAKSTRIALANYIVRFYRDHTVVVGLGEKSLQFLQTYRQGSRLVVVESDPDNSLIDRARGLGFNVMVCDQVDIGLLGRLNFERATDFLIFTDSDDNNIELVLKLLDITGRNNWADQDTRLHIHLDDIGLSQQLESHPVFSAEHSKTEIYFFSVYDMSARLLLRDYPSELFADVAGQKRIHLAIHDFGRLAEKVIVESLLLFQFRNQSRLRITVYDRDADRIRKRMRANHPHIETLCDVDYRQQDAQFAQEFLEQELTVLQSVTQHIFCGASDKDNLAQALRLRKLLLEATSCNAPIFVRMHRSTGLAQLVHADGGQPEIPDGIYAFGMLDQVMHADNVLSAHLESLAHAMHQMYVDDAATGDRAMSASRAWSQLTQSERKQNLLKADHWPVRLRATRYTCDEQVAPVIQYSEEAALLQAVMEHNRYVNQKLNAGWTFGELRSNAARTNPFLVPWEELPVEQRDKETADASAQASYIADNMGVFVKRRLVIGVTGHRLNRMDVKNQQLRNALRKSLAELREAHPDHHFTILSPLAEGSDRLVWELAREILGARLWVLLPLPYELYVDDFTSGESTNEFQQLLGGAEFCFEMPLKFGARKDLAIPTDNNPARNNQYALVGAYIAQRCDYLISIYDGQGIAGVGGTSQVLRWYESGEVDPEFEYPHEFFEPPHKRPALVYNPFPDAEH